jgi:hypothetical protein
MKMNFDNYECDGQMELVDYLDKLAAESKKCEGCIYYGHDFKCVREQCHKIDQAEGYHPIWYDHKGRIYGDFPLNKAWLPVITVCEKPNGKIYSVEAEAKDKTFKWSIENSKRKSFDDRVIAWREKYIGV